MSLKWAVSRMASRTWTGRVTTDIRDAEPDWAPFLQPVAPPGAPNVLMIVWDDVGFGAFGPVRRPDRHYVDHEEEVFAYIARD
jgi:hypothetical protein